MRGEIEYSLGNERLHDQKHCRNIVETWTLTHETVRIQQNTATLLEKEYYIQRSAQIAQISHKRWNIEKETYGAHVTHECRQGTEKQIVQT